MKSHKKSYKTDSCIISKTITHIHRLKHKQEHHCLREHEDIQTVYGGLQDAVGWHHFHLLCWQILQIPWKIHWAINLGITIRASMCLDPY